MTHREARKKLGSRSNRRSGTKTQALPKQSKPSGKGALAKYRNPRRVIRAPRNRVRVRQLVEASRGEEVVRNQT